MVAIKPIIINDAEISSGLTLRSNEVHVWSADLNATDARIQKLVNLLCPEERARGLRFSFIKHRRRFVAGRATLRLLLSLYLGNNPRDIEFTYGAWGKPALDKTKYGQELEFSLSHSEDLALYAFTLNRALGVDLEMICRTPELMKIAEQFFAPEEKSALGQLTHTRLQEAFLNCWTRKEAYLKAIGKGLNEDLKSVVVSVDSAEPPRILRLGSDTDYASAWSMYHLKPTDDSVGALAVLGKGCHLTFRCWTNSFLM